MFIVGIAGGSGSGKTTFASKVLGQLNDEDAIILHMDSYYLDVPPKHIYTSTGSLGHGIGIALGMALADKTQIVYVLLSDGECAEGSVWEALRLAGDLRIENLRVAVVANGWGAYGAIDVEDLDRRINTFYPTLVVKCNLFHLPDFMQGQNGHYCVMTDEQYKEINNKVSFGAAG